MWVIVNGHWLPTRQWTALSRYIYAVDNGTWRKEDKFNCFLHYEGRPWKNKTGRLKDAFYQKFFAEVFPITPGTFVKHFFPHLNACRSEVDHRGINLCKGTKESHCLYIIDEGPGFGLIAFRCRGSNREVLFQIQPTKEQLLKFLCEMADNHYHRFYNPSNFGDQAQDFAYHVNTLANVVAARPHDYAMVNGTYYTLTHAAPQIRSSPARDVTPLRMPRTEIAPAFLPYETYGAGPSRSSARAQTPPSAPLQLLPPSSPLQSLPPSSPPQSPPPSSPSQSPPPLSHTNPSVPPADKGKGKARAPTSPPTSVQPHYTAHAHDVARPDSIPTAPVFVSRPATSNSANAASSRTLDRTQDSQHFTVIQTQGTHALGLLLDALGARTEHSELRAYGETKGSVSDNGDDAMRLTNDEGDGHQASQLSAVESGMANSSSGEVTHLGRKRARIASPIPSPTSSRRMHKTARISTGGKPPKQSRRRTPMPSRIRTVSDIEKALQWSPTSEDSPVKTEEVVPDSEEERLEDARKVPKGSVTVRKKSTRKQHTRPTQTMDMSDDEIRVIEMSVVSPEREVIDLTHLSSDE